MANERTYDAQVQPIEVLSTIPAHMEGQDGVVLVIRPDPTVDARSKNIFVSKSQAARMLEDIGNMLSTPQPVWKQSGV